MSVVALALGLIFSANVKSIFSTGFTMEQMATAKVAMSFMAVNIAVTLFNSVFDSYVLALEEFRFQQTRQLFTTLVTPFAAYGLLCLGLGIVGVAIAQMAMSIVLLLLNASFCIGKLKMRFSLHYFDGELFREIAVFSVWIFVNQIVDLVNQAVPNVLLGALASASAVAVFAVSLQIRSVFFMLSTAISNVFIPRINQIVMDSNDNSILTALMTRVGRYQAVLYIWVLGGFALLGRFFIPAWAGEGFEEAYWLVLAMATPLFISLVQNTGIEIQRAKNMHAARSVCYIITAAINVAFTAIFCGTLGCWAPAIGFILHCIFGTGVFMNWYYQSRIGLDMISFWKHVLPVVCAGILATAISMLGEHFLPVTDWFGFFAWGALYTLVYLAVTAAIVLTPKERAIVIRKLRRV